MSYSLGAFPSSTPAWIRDWAALSRDWKPGDHSEPSMVFGADLPALWRLLSNEEVAVKLSQFERRIDKDNPAVRQDVFFLLQSACTGFRLSSMQANLSPHELEQRLTDLASKAKNLAIDADEFSYFLPDAINSAYLTERAGSDMPADFSRRRRSGLRKGTYALLHPETPSLTDLLLAFSDDILEEVSNLKRHGFKSDGGDDAAIRYQIRKLKYLMGQLFRKSNNPLIAAILSAINQQHISEDRVKKAVYKKGRNT
jgi:hypothetical protein